jgi:hypothetical protein
LSASSEANAARAGSPKARTKVFWANWIDFIAGSPKARTKIFWANGIDCIAGSPKARTKSFFGSLDELHFPPVLIKQGIMCMRATRKITESISWILPACGPEDAAVLIYVKKHLPIPANLP